MKEKNSSAFFTRFFVVSLSTFITRAIIYFTYLFASHTPKVVSSLAETKLVFHHFLLGFLFIILGFLTRRNKLLKYMVWIGVGIIIEEWTVLYENMGFASPIRYFSAFDVSAGLLIFSLCYVIVIQALKLRKKFLSMR